MSEKYILAHDMGTSSNKAVLMTIYGDLVCRSRRDYPLYHPQHGYAEQDPEDWIRAIHETTREVLDMSGISPSDIAGITFASQMQCILPVDRGGAPLMPAMTWLDARAADIMRRKIWTPPRIQGYNPFRLLRFLHITGGSPGHTGKDPFGKVLWLKENRPDIFANTYKFLDSKDYVIFRMTGKMAKSTDLAVVWWLLDTRNFRNRWHKGLCKLAGITTDMLPEVFPPATVIGNLNSESARKTGLKEKTPVILGAGDITSTALGSGALEDGELHIRIGTSGGVAGHFRKRKINIITYTGCIGSGNPEEYFLGIGAQETSGICLEWLKNKVLYHEEQLKEERQTDSIYQILDHLAMECPPGAEGLIFTPWMFGERCPLNDDSVRGGLFNIGLNHSREHIIRAVLEGIALNTRWALESLENLFKPVDWLNIVGGGAKSDTWCQIMADVTNRKIRRTINPQQASARGVALLSSYTLGFIPAFADIKNYVKIDREFEPTPENRKLYDFLFAQFKKLYKQNKKWYARMNRRQLLY